MADPEAPTYLAQRGAELMQLAALAGDFYSALNDLKLPDAIVHEIMVRWFDDELDGSMVVIDDD
jgi:hypothetical protein